mgnify:CR=1 FL=1
MSSGDYNGIYIAYFTGEYGTSMGLFVFIDGDVVGADLGGATYEGCLSPNEDATRLVGKIGIRMDPGGHTITGAVSDLPSAYETPVSLELPLEMVPYHAITTLTGPIHVRFEKKKAL